MRASAAEFANGSYGIRRNILAAVHPTAPNRQQVPRFAFMSSGYAQIIENYPAGKYAARRSTMNVFTGTVRALTRSAEATLAAAGALSGAAINGAIGGVQGAVTGVQQGLNSGRHSTPAAALTLAAIGATGLVEWPVVLLVGGTALAVRQLGQRARQESAPALSVVPNPPAKASASTTLAPKKAAKASAPKRPTAKKTAKASAPKRPTAKKAAKAPVRKASPRKAAARRRPAAAKR
jgi:hypothetical protein